MTQDELETEFALLLSELRPDRAKMVDLANRHAREVLEKIKATEWQSLTVELNGSSHIRGKELLTVIDQAIKSLQ